jgi:hypothetical protein
LICGLEFILPFFFHLFWKSLALNPFKIRQKEKEKKKKKEKGVIIVRLLN